MDVCVCTYIYKHTYTVPILKILKVLAINGCVYMSLYLYLCVFVYTHILSITTHLVCGFRKSSHSELVSFHNF